MISYDYSNDEWNTKGLLLLSDSYIARGDDTDAELMLQTVIDGKPKQEYIDEATAKLEKLKAKKAMRTSEAATNTTSDMKVDFKEAKGDKDLFDKLFDARQDSLKRK